MIRSGSSNNNQSFGSLLEALKSGNLDQISFSGNTVLQNLGQLTGITNQQATAAIDPSQKAIRGDFRNVLQSLRAAEGAIRSGNQEQIASTQNTLQQMMNQFQNDLSAVQSSGTGTVNQSSVQTDLQNFQNAVSGLLETEKSGNQDQVKAAQDTLQKAISQLQTDVPGLQHVRGHHHHPVNNVSNDSGISTTSSIGNGLSNYLNTLAGNYGLSQNLVSGLLNLKA
ncbi:MAG TPA: hypothetical protein VK564_05055 [Thermodesulfobacteriota bacterium]|nr:hypothetical protein [Thermodesulfobacteriota bacterium]